MAKKKPALTGLRKPSANFNFGANAPKKAGGKRKTRLARVMGGGS
jgi:hypothetical protein